MSNYTHVADGQSKDAAILEFGKDLGWEVEEAENANYSIGGLLQTGDSSDEDAYPMPDCRYRLFIQAPNQNLEEIYFWTLNFLRIDMGFPQIEKIYDVFSSSESSALWGNMGQRQSIQQDRAAQYLRGIGELVRTLFQIVRELRILDERLEPYARWKDSKSADVTLKGIYANLVEGGGNNPDSIYSLAAKVGFTVLPDLFFNTHVYDLDKIDEEIEKGSAKEFNNVVKTVLKRKLFGYINWKEKTEKEFISRRKFQLHYLRQHWHTIQLYMSWVKPYLRASKRMTARESHLNSPDLIGAFDTTRIEIEILAKIPHSTSKSNRHYQCIMATFSYKTQPLMTYKPEMQQQAVGHIGSCEMTFRSYGWHQKDIDAYKKMRRQEDLELLKLADEQVAGAFEALKDELEKYLEESENLDPTKAKQRKAEEAKAEYEAYKELYDKKKKAGKFAIIEPFASIFGGFVDMGKSFMPNKMEKPEKPKDIGDDGEEPNDKIKLAAASIASKKMYVVYNIYKKAHKLLNW